MDFFNWKAVRLSFTADCNRAMVRIRWRENSSLVSREEAGHRIAELLAHAMQHCELQHDTFQRDRLLGEAMVAYQELGWFTPSRRP